MNLNSILVSEFAKITNDNSETINNGTTLYGTYRTQGGRSYVQIDGSDVLTPSVTTSEARNGDRVTVLIKNHRAIITGNLTDPSASTTTVEEVKETVEFLDSGITDLKDTVTSMDEIIDTVNWKYTDASGNLITLSGKIDEVLGEADHASRVATNYIKFFSGTGLVIGNNIGSATEAQIGFNTMIDATSFNIRYGTTTLASFDQNSISLGDLDKIADISLCGAGAIEGKKYQSKVTYLTLRGEDSGFLITKGGNWAIEMGPEEMFISGSSGVPYIKFIKTTRGEEGAIYQFGLDGCYLYDCTSDLCKIEYSTLTGCTLKSCTVNGYSETGHDHSGLYSGSNRVFLTGTFFRSDSNGRYYLGGASYRWGEIYASKEVNTGSDMRLKKDFSVDFDKYIQMLDLLEPTSYHLINDDGSRHTGYIAQKVLKAMKDVGIEESEFGGLVKEMQAEGSVYTYGLRYGEFIPILHAKIKTLEARMNALENKEV